MRPFRYAPLPAHVIFGFGTVAALPEEMARLDCRRALVITTPEQAGLADLAKRHLGALAVGAFPDARMHTPVEVTHTALAYLRSVEADAVVGLGGGSTTGLCKALSLRTGLPQIVVPTTYAGSEATPILGETAGGKKTTQRSPKILPQSIVYDVDLTLTLPARMTVVSGLNAIAHAVEALYAKDVDPIIALMAREGIRSIARALPVIAARPDDREARSDALYGAWLCGTCLGAAGMALHHKLCHVLGGTFDLPHAETHAIVLPHVVAFNAPAAPEAMALVAEAMGVPDAAQGLYDLLRTLDVPSALRDIGMPEDGIDKAVALAQASPYWNPRAIDASSLTALLRNAYLGAPPNSIA